MPVERLVPAAPCRAAGGVAIPGLRRIAWTLVCAAVAACGGGRPDPVLLAKQAPAGGLTAHVRLEACGSAWCESLWIGPDTSRAVRVATLAAGSERCTEVAWTGDGRRAGFLVNGRQLRLYDAATQAPAGLVDLVPEEAGPSGRVARGVTFSDNGAAITFDDCPRERSGCRPGMVAVR